MILRHTLITAFTLVDWRPWGILQ